jgi:hypothetical protein
MRRLTNGCRDSCQSLMNSLRPGRAAVTTPILQFLLWLFIVRDMTDLEISHSEAFPVIGEMGYFHVG